MMLLSATSLLLSLETKLLSLEVVGKLWTVVRMIISSYTIPIMVVLEYLVSSSLVATSVK